MINNKQTYNKQLSVEKHPLNLPPGQNQETAYEMRITEKRLTVNTLVVTKIVPSARVSTI